MMPGVIALRSSQPLFIILLFAQERSGSQPRPEVIEMPRKTVKK
jgi:hypothetical protein